MKTALLLVTILTCTACQLPTPYAARPGTTDYWHPVRAKVEDSGKLMTCKGYVGRDEDGILYLCLFPVNHEREVPMNGYDPLRIQRIMWQIEEQQVFNLDSCWVDDSPVTISALAAVDFALAKANYSHSPWTFFLHQYPTELVREPNGKEWRITRENGEFQEVYIFGQGGPWSDRPEGAFHICEEGDPGSFTLDGIPMVFPYWNVLDWRGQEAWAPGIVQPRTPH